MLRIHPSFRAAVARARGAGVSRSRQAANGAIEGTITDSSGGVLPGVTVTITNVETGVERSVVTNEKGSTARRCCRSASIASSRSCRASRSSSRPTSRCRSGRPRSSTRRWAVGTVSETITVSSSDIPALDIARIDIGHTMSDLEVHNLPLVARNPYNFALVQPGVTGIENVEFGVPRLAANGAAMRINYHDRRQHEHREGPRRPAPAADVGSDDSGSEGRDHRLRAGVRPDDGHGLQRGDAVGDEHLPRRRQLSVPAQAVQRVSVLLRLRQHDGRLRTARRPTRRRPTTNSTPAPPTSAGRSSRTSCSSTAAGSRRAAICRRAA